MVNMNAKRLERNPEATVAELVAIGRRCAAALEGSGDPCCMTSAACPSNSPENRQNPYKS